MSVNDQILDAIELLARTSVERAGYDKTIQAQIISCQDPSIGKYKCRYQDAIFYAYIGKSDVILTKGTYVYVLIPENDMSKEKTIIGTVDRLGIDYRSSIVGEQAYSIIGTDVIQDTGIFYLDTDYENYSYVLYDENTGYQDQNLNLNIQALNQYIKQASSLIIGMMVKTNIQNEKQKLGSYGISFTLEFKDDNGNTGIERIYTLDENEMIDNPYNLIYPTRQYVIFDIDGKNFIKVKQIKIFNKDFPESGGESHVKLNTGDIELTNLEMKCAIRMTEEEINGLSLTVIAPQGTVFLNQNPKTLQAQIKFKGVVVPPDNVSFYWGFEDLRVTPQRKEDYNKYLGRGWKCINEKNIVSTEDGQDTSIQWISYGNTYIFEIGNAPVRDNKIKVAAVYDGNVISKQINIQNLTSNAYSIVINSTNGTEFYYGIGSTQLQCHIFDSSSNQIYPSSYAWGWENAGRELQSLSSTTSTYTVEAKYISNFAIYKCSVYNNSGICLGTGSIKLINSTQSGNINPLTIQNGTALYKYNEKGLSPTSRTLQNPQIIQVLSFKMYNDKGNEIQIFHNDQLDARASVKWKIPSVNTLLKPVEENLIVEDGYYIIQNTKTLTYDIQQRYDPRKTINQIILQVTYDGAASIAQTNLTFTKQGQIGTNGTDYYVNIVPNAAFGTTSPRFPMITKFGNNGLCKLNYSLPSGSSSTNIISENTAYQFLKVQFLHGEEKILPDGITWRVLKNHYGYNGENSIDDDSNFIIIDQTVGTMQFTSSLENDQSTKANIIECEILYNNHLYYGAIPFITAYMENENSTFDLKDGTGFHYVMYSSDGMQPEYSNLPFEFVDKNNQIVQGTCSVHGNIKVKNNNSWSLVNSGDLIQNNGQSIPPDHPERQFDIKPIGFYKGECVNNSVRYEVSGVGIINIPIHFYLNRYNFAHLNGWDGNSIQINEEDGYILAPQMGAGKKQSDNSFTGVLMGQVKKPAENYSNYGLFGYNKGGRTFFLNSQNGAAILGGGQGQIIIDPGTVDNGGNIQNNKALLYSYNFWKPSNYNTKTGLPISYDKNEYYDQGMLIDLTTPQIVFGNERFKIDSNGSIYAGRVKENGHYTNKYNFYVDATTGDVNVTGAIYATSLTLGQNVTLQTSNIAGLQDYLDQIDGKIQTWYQNSDPSTNWSSDEKSNHVGDLWYYTGATVEGGKIHNSTYRWNGNGWELLQVAVPQSLFDSIDGKAQIFTVEPYTPYHAGDLWIKADGSLWHCTTDRSEGNFNANDWTNFDYITDSHLAEVYIRRDGTISNNIPDWSPDHGTYSAGDYVIYQSIIYKCLQNHTASLNRRPGYNTTYWQVETGDISSSAFLVSSQGLLTASNAIIYGTLYSSRGKIGGWTLAENKLYTGTLGASNGIYFMPNGTNTATINNTQRSDWAITAGANFGVTRSGGLYSNDATISGTIIANNGKIGGTNGWTIGSATASGNTPARGFIFSGSKNSLSSTNSGIYMGTDGVSVVNTEGQETFRINQDGTITIRADITIEDASIEWNDINNIPSDLAYTGDITTAINNYDSGLVKVPSYITSTKITQTTIESPTIYAGYYYATGQGYNSGAAYYIYNGNPQYSGATQVGYISYDTHGSGTTEEAANRVIFRTMNSTPLKILSAGNISIETPGNAGWVYLSALGGGFRVDSKLCLNSSSYGTGDPPSPSLYGSAFAGMLYFKIVS